MQSLRYYHLGELVIDSPKVNYKLNYKPGEVLDPYSKEWIPYDKALPLIMEINKLKAEEKQNYQNAQAPLRINPDLNC
jgi:hypothetical protein